MGDALMPVAWRYRWQKDDGPSLWVVTEGPLEGPLDEFEIENLYGPEAASRIAELEAKLAKAVGALELAANRLDRLSLETPPAGRLRAESVEWIAEARNAARARQGGPDNG